MIVLLRMERDWRPFVYGGLASCAAEFGTFPIDTTKTRLQVQGQKHDVKFTTLKYNGMIDCFFKMTRQEGFLALYSGIWPAVVRQATYGTIKFGTYYSLKRFIVEHYSNHPDPNTPTSESIRVNVACAVVAGAVASAIACPTDVLKVRMQVAGIGGGKGGESSGLLGCFLLVWRQEGIAGLWKGVHPTAQRAAVIAAVELPVYDFCKSKLMNSFGDRISNHFISSVIASLGSAIASTPIDVIRTRLMNQRKLKPGVGVAVVASDQLYNGTIDCMVKTVRHEGFWALYKGFIPTWVRMGPWNVIFFITYEQLKLIY